MTEPLAWLPPGANGTVHAVAPDPAGGYTIYTVRPDGTLLVAGTRWKECPMPARPCPRRGRDPLPTVPGESEKCSRCSYSGKCKPGDMAFSIRVAECIQVELLNQEARGNGRRT